MNSTKLLGLAFALAALAGASPASATATYPSEVAKHLGVSCVPACTICHQTDAGGAGTATTPFATGMRARGLAGGGNTAALDAALDAVVADNYDSNGNGVNDVDELKNCGDPNAGVDLPPAPGYGCMASRGRSSGAVVALAMGALGLVVARRRRRG